MSQQPKHFLLWKIVGVVGVFVFVTAVILAITGFGDFESNSFMIGSLLLPLGVVLTVLGITIGFAPEIAKARAKTIRQIQEATKEDLTAIASATAEIMSDAVTTTASAVAEGMRETKFCKHCGKEIDIDAKFCSICGKEQ